VKTLRIRLSALCSNGNVANMSSRKVRDAHIQLIFRDPNTARVDSVQHFLLLNVAARSALGAKHRPAFSVGCMTISSNMTCRRIPTSLWHWMLYGVLDTIARKHGCRQ